MEKKIAKDLLSIGAVFLRPEQPFTWASGIKSPIYCDNRLTLTAPVVRGHVEAGLAEIVRTKFPEAEVLMGTSTAGIAHAAITATILDLPMGYVRSGSKDHGRGNRIEGRLEKGQKVVVIEDLISTGGSCIEVVEALREAGAEVLGVASIFTYGMQKGLDRMREANVTNYSLSNLDALVEVAAEEGYIKPGDKARLIAFRNNPSDELDAIIPILAGDFRPSSLVPNGQCLMYSPSVPITGQAKNRSPKIRIRVCRDRPAPSADPLRAASGKYRRRNESGTMRIPAQPKSPPRRGFRGGSGLQTRRKAVNRDRPKRGTVEEFKIRTSINNLCDI